MDLWFIFNDLQEMYCGLDCDDRVNIMDLKRDDGEDEEDDEDYEGETGEDVDEDETQGDADDEDEDSDDDDRMFAYMFDLMEILEDVDMDAYALNSATLVDIFHDLSLFNDDAKRMSELEITGLKIGELKPIYKQLSRQDGTFGSPYEQRKDDEVARFEDLTMVYHKLTQHFTYEEEKQDEFKDYWNKSDELRSQLSTMFSKLSEYFRGEKVENFEKVDLWFIYDSLALIFSKPIIEGTNLVDEAQMPSSVEYITEVSSILLPWNEDDIDYEYEEMHEVFLGLTHYYDAVA